MREQEPYQAEIVDSFGEVRRAMNSLFTPELRDPYRRAWFEHWEIFARRIHPSPIHKKWGGLVLDWCGPVYVMESGGAASLCDAWAEGSVLYLRDGYSTKRVGIIDAHLRNLKRSGGVYLASEIAAGMGAS